MLRLENVSKTFLVQSELETQEIQALKGISLEIADGDFVAIMGSSGSGKSSLLNILGLLDTPTSGQYFIKNQSTEVLNEDDLAHLRLKSIGFVFQQFNLLPKLTALENICMPLVYSNQEANTKESQSYAHELLKSTGMQGREEHFPAQLSGGQQQRVAICRALINKPLIVLADEPTGNLDSQSEQEILSIFKKLHNQGSTIVIVTHDESVAEVANRVVRMKDGVIVSDTRRVENVSQGLSDTPLEVPVSGNLIEKVRQYSQQGLRSLKRNRSRSLLSMLGILIGVASVVAMLAIGNGAQKSIEAEFSALGTKLLVLKASTLKSGTGVVPHLKTDDGEILKKEIPSILRTSAVVYKKLPISYADRDWSSQVLGVESDYQFIRHSTAAYGRFFTSSEVEERARVALIGPSLLKNYFHNRNPLGEEIKIDKTSFRIIGVLPKKGSDGDLDRDNTIVIPLTTAMYSVMGREFVDSYDVEIDSQKNAASVERKISDILLLKHHLSVNSGQNYFEVKNMAAVLQAMNKTNRTMYFLLTLIASISLIVGGIGIMNVMLAAIAERTKEIGLRKAVGGRNQDILFQFLLESILLSAIGGVAGMATGIAVSVIISSAFSWPTYISIASLVVSFGFSVFVGIFFGYFPAKKASEKNPIQALKGL